MTRPPYNAGRVGSVRRDLVRKVRQIGLIGAIKHASWRLSTELSRLASHRESNADPFDAKYGTDTARMVSVGSLDIPDNKLEHANRYEAIVPHVFDGMIHDLPIVHDDFVFIDMGSGKGRAILLASLYPFRQIIGVELSAVLTRRALANLRVFKDERQKCHSIMVLCEDVTSYVLPDERLVLYFYDPFDRVIMERVVKMVEESLDSCQRKIYVVYQQPLHRTVWDESQRFQLVKSADRHVLYESRCA